MKIPSLKIYQKYARIYLDEYPEQKKLREEYFKKRLEKQKEIARIIGEPYISSIPETNLFTYSDLINLVGFLYSKEENVFLTDFIKKRFLKRQ